MADISKTTPTRTRSEQKSKGRIGEAKVQALLKRAGWTAGLQPGSGSVGTASVTRSLQGDLWARCGEARLRIEVKNYKNEPRTLQALRAGSDVLAYICSSTGRMAVFIDEGLFCDLLAWSADALSRERREP